MKKIKSFPVSFPVSRFHCWSAFLVFCLGLFSLPARGAVLSWSGGGGANANWNNSANWGFVGTPNNGDTLIFPASQPNLINTNNIAGLTLNQIVFAGPGGGYDIRGNAFTLTNNLEATNTAGANIIENNITLAQTDQTINVATTLTLDGMLSGSVGVIKTGAGALIYQYVSDNTYTGTTLVSAGTLELNVDGFNAFGGPLVIGDGSGLGSPTVENLQESEISESVPITINLSGLLNLNNYFEPVGPNLTLSGGTIETGTGELSLSANTTINVTNGVSSSVSGNLDIGTGTLNLDGNGNLNIYANVSGSASIVQNDPLSTYWSGANTFAGNYTDNSGGFVDLGSSTALGNVTNTMTVNDPGWVALSGNINLTNQSLVINSTFPGGALYVFTGSNSWQSSFTLGAACRFQVFTNCSMNLNGPITGSGGFTTIGQGILTLSGSFENTYAGATVVTNGILQLNHTSSHAIGASSSITIGNGVGPADSDIIRYINPYGNQIDGGIPITINDSGLLDLNGQSDDAGPFTLSAGDISTGSGTLIADFGDFTVPASDGKTPNINGHVEMFGNTITVDNGLSFPALQLNASLSDDGEGFSIVSGVSPAAFVRMTASNSFTGPLTIQDLTVTAETPWALGTTNGGTVVTNNGELFMYSTAITNEPLLLVSSSQLTAQNNCSWVGPMTIEGPTAINTFYGGMLFDIVGAISGTGNLSCTGVGTNRFSGSTTNTYVGTTTVSSGTLLLNKSSYLNAAIPGNVIIASNATLRLQGTEQIADTADVLVQSGGLFDFTTQFESINTLHGTGNVNFGAEGYLEIGANNGTSEFDGLMSGTGFIGGFTVGKYGTGTFTMTANNTYANGSDVFGGKLVINGFQPQSPVLSMSTGTTLGGSGTVGTISANGAISPGNSPGILSCSNVNFTANGSLVAELTGPNPGAGGYDQLNVTGTVSLANATLTLVPAFTNPVPLGQQFVIVNNDGADAITGTFLGLPEGSTISAGSYKFHLSYVGGTGNDVVLSLTSIPGAAGSATVTSGDGSHGIDPNGCNNLGLSISNTTASAMTGVTATLSTTTEGVIITQPYSDYPNIPGNGSGTNLAPFQISTLPTFACGTPINLQLGVNSSLGSFTVNTVLNTGETAAPTRFDNNTVTNVPDVGTLISTNNVAAWSGGPITKVTASLWLGAPIDSDMTLSLISPNGTNVVLASGVGGSNPNFGTGSADASRTTFDDSATTAIAAGSAPFVGTFQPQSPLAAFIGTSPVGAWRLQLTDGGFFGSPDTLRAWSLFLYGTSCASGSGPCSYCLTSINGSITNTDLIQSNRMNRNLVVASCGSPKPFPGAVGGLFNYDAYTFTNTSASEACVTVVLTAGCDVQAGVYLNSFNPAEIATNYLADSGSSTGGGAAPQSCSASIPPGATFVVTVNEVSSGAGCSGYNLQVSGLPCPPPTLNIQTVVPNQARLYWSTAAGGYLLESETNATAGAWATVTNEPIVNGGNYNVTNSAALPTNRFYRLHMP
ncbi:MAG TPA: autotransporter-associated beta strand repeat-containing protein [Verrucomicrobiae bacterium]|jgi:autotransporter-associated beta strand protein|nr:autotransporter-associated beta strand repeat-containing protein [Verrucomicrobiae bacterium]